MEHHRDFEINEFSGFAIVALDCLLIETLGQFYKGIDRTPRPHNQHFVDFFQGSDHFLGDFDDTKSEIFYDHFRCGILHQAQTKKMSRIRFGLDSMVRYADAADPWQGLIVDRVRLHRALLDEINDYESLLKAPRSAANQAKKESFIAKWRFIVP
jgi:hypothetical protein